MIGISSQPQNFDYANSFSNDYAIMIVQYLKKF